MVVTVLTGLWWSCAGVLSWTDLFESLGIKSRHQLSNVASRCTAGHDVHIPCLGLKLRGLKCSGVEVSHQIHSCLERTSNGH